jgi:hypothetical protein
VEKTISRKCGLRDFYLCPLSCPDSKIMLP